MDLLYPRMSRARLVASVRIAMLGAALGAVYGALHDQVSYSIAPEYFTKLKFVQFDYAEFGAAPRVFVAEVGALGSWWVGMVAGWVLCRAGFRDPSSVSFRGDVLRAFGIIAAGTVASGFVGATLGVFASRGDLAEWDGWRRALRLLDVPAFVVVAYLHWASYAGGLLGLVLAVFDARRRGAARCRAVEGAAAV